MDMAIDYVIRTSHQDYVYYPDGLAEQIYVSIMLYKAFFRFVKNYCSCGSPCTCYAKFFHPE
jgi:hypothetical protein